MIWIGLSLQQILHKLGGAVARQCTDEGRHALDVRVCTQEARGQKSRKHRQREQHALHIEARGQKISLQAHASQKYSKSTTLPKDDQTFRTFSHVQTLTASRKLDRTSKIWPIHKNSQILSIWTGLYEYDTIFKILEKFSQEILQNFSGLMKPSD